MLPIVLCMSLLLKIYVPATMTFAPAATASPMVVALIPPSTCRMEEETQRMRAPVVLDVTPKTVTVFSAVEKADVLQNPVGNITTQICST